MNKYISLFSVIFIICNISAQEISKDDVDMNYREDQIYAGITYNLLINRPEGVTQQGFSRGLHLGLLRDMPFNKKRTLAIAVGVGYSYDLVYSNMLAILDGSTTSYYIGDLKENNVSRSYFQTHSIELPVEFRWRNSTPDSHKFWRFYTGLKLGYTYSATSLFTREGLSISFKNPDIADAWQLKAYTTFGYNTWNFYVQYSFIPLFKEQKTVNNHRMESNLLQIGLMFYIL